jgi:hypothetical protein
MKNIFYVVLIVFLVTINSMAQTIYKDTIFFKFDKKYILEAKDNSGDLILFDSNSSGTFYFQKKDTLYNLNPKKVICLKKFIHKSNFFRKDFYRKLDDFGLCQYFEKYIIFLVDKRHFIQVDSRFEID